MTSWKGKSASCTLLHDLHKKIYIKMARVFSVYLNTSILFATDMQAFSGHLACEEVLCHIGSGMSIVRFVDSWGELSFDGLPFHLIGSSILEFNCRHMHSDGTLEGRIREK